MSRRDPRAARTAVLTLLLALGLLALPATQPASSAVPGSSVAPAVASRASDGAPDAVVERRVIGRSVKGRAIRAYRLGEHRRRGVPRVVLMATMHGNEGAPRQILRALVDGRPIVGVDLWVVPTYNPDGLAAHGRRNAHGVDLNRNFPYDWVDLDGNYESGPKPASEPETRAMMRFLTRVRPDRILSFHQPLNGVDIDTKRPAFARKVARELRLPINRFDCGGVCHGTMTGWFNHRFDGAALTVEYDAHPSRHLMRDLAPRRVLAIFGARRGRPAAAPARAG